ncbi:MAG: hypothetical protein ACFB2W_06810 [Leptolyngbyaceae cyanobacterium]
MHRVLYLALVFLVACGAAPIEPDASPSSVPEAVSESVSDEVPATDAAPVADIDSVAITGEAGSYTFAVTISSNDTGCDQYADWWEVVNAETGELLYRRILVHSHVDEQPFTRSGGPVAVASDQVVIVRGHMGGLQPGYGGQMLKGSVESGFEPAEEALPSLEAVEPLPTGCTF